MTKQARPVHLHRTFSDIEIDVAEYYSDITTDAQLTATKIAGRALAIVRALVEPADWQRIDAMKQEIDRLIVQRQNERERTAGNW